MELSKKDKKCARQVIELGLQREFANGLFSFEAIIKNWKEQKLDNQESYQLLFKTLKDFDKHIASRYDYMKSSNYLFIIAAQLNTGIIALEELSQFEFSNETIQKIKFLISF